MSMLWNFILKLYEIFTSNKISKIGTTFLLLGSFLLIGEASYGFTYYNDTEFLNINITNDNPGLIVQIIGIIFLLFGALILIFEYFHIFSEKVILYFGNTLNHGDSKPPKYAMSKNDRINPNIVQLGLINTYDKEELFDEYIHILKSFKRREEHKESSKIYLAALGSTPYLFLLGTLIRNGHIKNEVLDYNRDKGKWYRLDSIGEKRTHSLMYEDTAISVDDKLEELVSNDSNAIGIALAYTFKIYKTSVPEELRENTLYLTHSLGFGNDRLDDIQSQTSLLDELALYIDRIRSVHKEVHLFISAQASVCINIGKRYQDNTMENIYIHNFKGADRKYDWSISFNKGKIA